MRINSRKILIIDDEEGIREQLKWSLKYDYEVFLAANAKQGLNSVKKVKPDLVILDLTLSPNGDDDEGLQVFEDIQLINPRIKVIIITGNEQKELAFKAVQLGAYDFYQKPIELEEFNIIIKRAFHLLKLESEIELKTINTSEDSYNHEIIGKCPAMLEVYELIQKTSQTNATVLIASESGTGKELIAKAIHHQSARSNFPFIVINCGAIPENLLESELFGHEKGAFTGAHIQRKGKFELANKGTLFLDEIGELNITLQVKLLRFLQEREIERVGGRESIELDVRIIAATNKNLEEEIEMGNFRDDLFYRLCVLSINLPPLRERGDDILILANHFLTKFNHEFKSNIRGFTLEAKNLIKNYRWPGNVRELENKIKRAVIMAKKAFIVPEDLHLMADNKFKKRTLKSAVEEYEEKCIREALFRNQGNVSRTAEELGVNRTTFYDLLHKYHIEHAKYNIKPRNIKSEIK